MAHSRIALEIGEFLPTGSQVRIWEQQPRLHALTDPLPQLSG